MAGLVKQSNASLRDPVLRSAAEGEVAESTGLVRPRRHAPANGRVRSARPAYPSAGHVRGEAAEHAVGSDFFRPPTPEEAKLLELLEHGMKDRAIARALGIGERTVQRRLSRLMATLDARTRFQAAINAVQRGWL